MNYPEERNFRLIQTAHFKKYKAEKDLETPSEETLFRNFRSTSPITGWQAAL